MLGYCYLTRGWDNSIIHPCCTCANVILPYRTSFYDNNNNNNSTAQGTTIIFRILTGTIRFDNDKIQTHTHLVQYGSVVKAFNETLTFYFWKCLSFTIFRTNVYIIVSVQYVDQKMLKYYVYDLRRTVSIQNTRSQKLWLKIGTYMGIVRYRCYSRQAACEKKFWRNHVSCVTEINGRCRHFKPKSS